MTPARERTGGSQFVNAQAWVNGDLVDESEATVSIFDHAITTGDGVFETLQVVGDGAFAVTRHLARLRRSAEALGLSPPSDEVVADAIAAVVAGGSHGLIRLTVTGGPGPLASGRGDAGPTTIVAGGPLGPWPEVADVVTVPWPRNDRGALAGVKSISYAENVVALLRAHAVGASEAIFANLEGNLCEGTGTNVFIVIGGRLVTPPLTAGCLAGVTRELLVDALDVTELDLPLEALRSAEEAFLTSSTRDAQSIANVDGEPIANAPGPVAKEAAATIQRIKESNPDP